VRFRLTAVETWLVVLISAHTVAVGAMLLLAPVWSCTVFGGWSTIGPLFFPRQAGIFHFVLAFGYLWEYFRHRGIALMVAAKAFALVFLLAATAFDQVPWVVPFSGLIDGAMGVVIVLVHLAAARQRTRPLDSRAPIPG